MKLWKKITLGILEFVLILLLVLGITIYSLWGNELKTVNSIKVIVDAKDENRSGPVYYMDVSGDYYFDDFLKEGGASNDQELIDFIVKNLTKGIIPLSIEAPNIGCSSFTAKTSDGTRLFGRNYDFSTTTGMLVTTKGNEKLGRHATISSVDLQFLGIKDGVYLESIMDKALCLAAPYAPLDGINSAGVACGIYMSYQGNDSVTATNQMTDKPDLTSTTMLRMILDYADDVEEAVELVKQYDLHDSANTSFHYMVADAKGKSAILEWVAPGVKNSADHDGSKRELVVHYNDSDEYIGLKEGLNNFQYVTNFIVNPNYYDSDEEKGGLDRYNEIERLINPDGKNKEGIITKEKALEILEIVGRRKWDVAQGESDKNGITVWSGLYDLTNKKLTWVSNEEFTNEKAIFNIELIKGKFQFV